MEINEVKIGDDVSFTHNKKKVSGKVIHRHDGSNTKDAKAALMGHVNVQIHGDKSYPVTVHVSKLKPALKEEQVMENINEHILDLIDNIDSGNHVEANNIFNSLMQSKIDVMLDVAKEEVAKNMFNTQDCAECDEQNEETEVTNEALKGGQHKIDANKNGKIDAHDFKLLRGRKTAKTERTDSALAKRVEHNKKNVKEEAGVEEAVVIKPTPDMQRAIDAYKKKRAAAASSEVPKTRETPAVRSN